MGANPRCVWLLLGVLYGCPGGTPEATDDTDVVDRGLLLGVGLSPREPSIEVGQVQEFSLRAFYEDTSSEDISATATWAIEDASVASIDGSGKVTGLSQGTTSVFATSADGLSAKTSLTVRAEADAPVSIALRPGLVELEVDGSIDMAVEATFGDGTTGNIASSCTWSSEDPGVATVADGRVVGVAEGKTSVSATCEALSSSAPVTVRTGEVVELPDLQIGEILHEVDGGELVVLAEVKNAGTGSSPITFVDLYTGSSRAPTAADTADGTDIVDVLAPGEETSVYFEVSPIPTGSFEFWLAVDIDEAIRESNETNNVAGPITAE